MAGYWFCKHGERELGPYSTKQLQLLVQSGKLKPDALLRSDESQEWQPAVMVEGLFPEIGSEPAPAKAVPAKSAAAGPRVVSATPAKASPAKGAASLPRGKPLAVPTNHDTAEYSAETSTVSESPSLPRGKPLPAAPMSAAPQPVVTPAPTVSPFAINTGAPAASPFAVNTGANAAAVPATSFPARGAAPGHGNEGDRGFQLAVGSLVLGGLGLACFAFPYGALGLGVLGVVLGTVCFIVPMTGNTPYLAIGGVALGVIAGGLGGFLANRANTPEPVPLAAAPKPEEIQKPVEEPSEAELDAKAKAKAEAEQKKNEATPVASASPAGKKPEVKAQPGVEAVAPMPAVKVGPFVSTDPRSKVVSATRYYGKYQAAMTLGGEKRMKVSRVWYTDEPTTALPAALAVPASPRPTADPAVDGPEPAPEVAPAKKPMEDEIPPLDITGELENPKAKPKPIVPKPVEPKAAPKVGPKEPAIVVNGLPKSGRYMCFELSMTNVGKTKPWKVAVLSAIPGDLPTAPILYDNREEPADLVPPESPKEEGTRDINPGEEVSEVLIFETPPEGFDFVRLVIPAVSISASQNFGFEIPAAAFSGEKPAANAGPRPAATPASEPATKKPKPLAPGELPPLPGEDGTPEEGEKPNEAKNPLNDK